MLARMQAAERATSAWCRAMTPLAMAASLLGCATAPIPRDAERTSPLILTSLEQAGVRDLRASFRDALCARLAPGSSRPCDDVLVRVGDEPAAAPAPHGAASAALRFRIALVPGLFADCMPLPGRPFADALAALRADGFDVVDLPVDGRGGVAHNAARLARELTALPDDPRPLIVFCYSKGLPDLLEAVVQQPRLRRNIAAVVGIAGAINGTPLADRAEGLYRATLMQLPITGCAPGSGDEVHDLRRDVRTAWWRAHGGRIGVPIYSIVALPRQGRVSPVLAAGHGLLARIDPSNDGQLLWSDAVAAPGALLGYVDADHWAIAMQLSVALPLLAPLFRDDVPRAALLQSAIEVVAQDLATR